MKIVSLFGSPRPTGNSTTLAKHFLKTAENLGAESTTFALNQLNYRGCQGCYACKTKLEKCVLNDDLTGVLEAVSQADVVVLSTGTFYGEITSQLKAFIDRTFSYLKPDYMTNLQPMRIAPGKKLVFIITQGGPENRFADVFPRYDQFFRWYGFTESHLIRAYGTTPKAPAELPERFLRQAEEIARRIMS